MGTRIVFELWATDKAQGNAAIEAVLAEMRRVDEAMSTYKPTSELSIVNAPRRSGADQDLCRVVRSALHRARIFTHHRRRVRCHLCERRLHVRFPEACARMRNRSPRLCRASTTGTSMLDPKNSTVHFARPGMRIDLGGIGKKVTRWIEASRFFRRGASIMRWSRAGGDSRIIGDRFGQPWVVGIRHPDRKDEVIARIPLEDAALSTSGDYERYFDENGVRYHHIIDPKTGHSASKVRSATIIGPTATRTDGLSKTAFVLGPEKAIEIYNRLDDIDAVLVTPEGKVLYTKELAPPEPPATK